MKKKLLASATSQAAVATPEENTEDLEDFLDDLIWLTKIMSTEK